YGRSVEEENLCSLSYPSFFAQDGTPMDAARTALYETSARILLLSIRWAQSALLLVTGSTGSKIFVSMNVSSQVALLEETWSDLFLISCIQWSMPLESNPLFADMDASVSKSNVHHKKCVHALQRIFARFKILAVDFSEFACLKAIVLFKPDVESLKDNHQVDMLQDHAQLMLAHHIKSQHFDYTFRFGRLLLLLPSLRQIPPAIIETIFFSKTIGSTPIVKLLGDLFKC
ncbi:photoreceptor-specific nuclear receptor, partial [Caerostris extrusa]